MEKRGGDMTTEECEAMGKLKRHGFTHKQLKAMFEALECSTKITGSSSSDIRVLCGHDDETGVGLCLACRDIVISTAREQRVLKQLDFQKCGSKRGGKRGK